MSHSDIGPEPAAPRGIEPRLSHTTVPPRLIFACAASNPPSVIDTWRPLGGVGGGELVVDVEVTVELVLDVDVTVEVVVVTVLDVDVAVLEVETLVVGDGVGEGDPQEGGIGSGAGKIGCQLGSMSSAALGAG